MWSRAVVFIMQITTSLGIRPYFKKKKGKEGEEERPPKTNLTPKFTMKKKEKRGERGGKEERGESSWRIGSMTDNS